VVGKTVDLVQAALDLGFSYQKAYTWVMAGKLKGERMDGKWRVDQKDLQRLVEERLVRLPT